MLLVVVMIVVIVSVCVGIVYGFYSVLGGSSFVSGVGFWCFILGSVVIIVLMVVLVLCYFYVSDCWSV